ncbi:hypothetical protein KIN20_015696 [Parelaphostrongylus tenuis]|uniref:Uncharacterized protein n=1 Tax=Parelaphostrongylus tenuis TaxID=148309 RepID=A0AAD5N0L9_PARTN|nr:hypothetical protein KIN20_015696 [Parelaphostrongylus tenuis]
MIAHANKHRKNNGDRTAWAMVAEQTNDCDAASAVTISTTDNWPKYFKEGNIGLEDMPRYDRLSALDKSDFQTALDAEPPSSSHELDEEVVASQLTFVSKLYLSKFVYVKPP